MKGKHLYLIYGVLGFTGMIFLVAIAAVVVAFGGGGGVSSSAFELEDNSGNVCYYYVESEIEVIKTFRKYGLYTTDSKNFIGKIKALKQDPTLVFAILNYQGKELNDENINALIKKFNGSRDANTIINTIAPEITSSEGIVEKDSDFIYGVQEIFNELKPMLICSSEEDAKNGVINESGGSVVIGNGIFSKPLNKTSLRVTSNYGYRIHPINKTAHLHRGTDFSCTKGEQILSVMPGVVYAAKPHSSWGNYVLVDHQNGIYTLYAHMTDIIAFTGSRVVGGQVIGTCGSTGASTNPHLHFEVHLNKPYGTLTDPLSYFKF